MALRFTKMHGLGNDYVYVNAFAQPVSDARALARKLADRNRGVGGDGLILIAPPSATDLADVRMEMYNADGSRAQMCGNGIRCVAKYAYERGLARVNPMRVQSDAGVHHLDLTLDERGRVTRVRVDMGAPVLEARRIPVAVGQERVIDMALPLEARILQVTCVSMGNPHAVIYTEQVAAVPLREWGSKLERHPLFPERINVHFVQVLRPDKVKMVTWERGAGPTQACGTGASAVCVAGVLTRRSQRAITAQLPGGELSLEWDEPSNHVFMTGPATEVFDGEWLGEPV